MRGRSAGEQCPQREGQLFSSDGNYLGKVSLGRHGCVSQTQQKFISVVDKQLGGLGPLGQVYTCEGFPQFVFSCSLVGQLDKNILHDLRHVVLCVQSQQGPILKSQTQLQPQGGQKALLLPVQLG
eukprot:3788854-Amphidinium_carterae.1